MTTAAHFTLGDQPSARPLFRQDGLRVTLAVLLFSAGIIAAFTASTYGRELLAEIAIAAIVAMSLDFLAGYGGMVSLGHAGFYGAGAYVYAALCTKYGVSPFAAIGSAVAFGGIAGWLIGMATSRAQGIFFIMATMAFGQMAYAFVFESKYLGGDDGLTGVPRPNLKALGINLQDSSHFCCTLVLLAGLVYLLLSRLLASGFGHALVGVHRNEARMRALGLATARTKAAAFGIAGAIASLAGTMGACLNGIASPEFLHWTVSGEMLLNVILGGIESLIGPVIGTAVVILMKHVIQGYTDHWPIFIGCFLIVAVLAGGRGLYGLLADVIAWRPGRQKSASRTDASLTQAPHV